MIVRLLDALEVHLGQALRHDSKRLGLTEATARVLLALELSEVVPMALIAERLGREPSTATRFVDRAERDGFVVRVAGEKDRRSRLVRLSPKGEDQRRILLDQRAQRGQAVESAVAAELGLGADQVEWFLSALAKAAGR